MDPLGLSPGVDFLLMVKFPWVATSWKYKRTRAQAISSEGRVPVI
jgi:hypothetical protein